MSASDVTDAVYDAIYEIVREAIESVGHEAHPYNLQDFTDRIVALVRPVEGVVLSREEAADCAYSIRSSLADNAPLDEAEVQRLEALAARLEANAQPGRNLGGRSSG